MSSPTPTPAPVGGRTPATVSSPTPAPVGGSTPPPTAPELSGVVGESSTTITSADPRVDDAVARLADVDALPVAEQVEVYADIHRRLAAVLSDPDSQA